MISRAAAPLAEDIVEILHTTLGRLDFKAKVGPDRQRDRRTQDLDEFLAARIRIKRRYDHA